MTQSRDPIAANRKARRARRSKPRHEARQLYKTMLEKLAALSPRCAFCGGPKLPCRCDPGCVDCHRCT